MSDAACLNCGHKLHDRFCPSCGQKADTGPVTLHSLAHTIWHGVTHTDKGYLSLAWNLFARPGVTIRNYLAGKRKRIFDPFTFYLVTTSALIFLTGVVFEKEDATYNNIHNEFGRLTQESVNLILLVALPLFALPLWLFFRSRLRNYAESITTLVFAFGHLNFILLLMNVAFWVFIGLHYHYYDVAVLIAYACMLRVIVLFLAPLRGWDIPKLLLLAILFIGGVEAVGKGLVLYLYGVPLETILNSF
jgi:Protein of unknown function (DUF3667)